MKLLRKVKIGCLTYEVKYVKDVPKEYKSKVKSLDLWGFCDHDSQSIYLKVGMSKERLREVFIHECLHMIEEAYGINLGEKKVNTLGLAIADLIKTNRINFL